VVILTHSYIGMAALLYASGCPDRVSRIVLIGSPPPCPAKSYHPELRSYDGTLEKFNEESTNLRLQIFALPPRDQCHETWHLLRKRYIAVPRDAGALRWAPCDYPNETGFMIQFGKCWNFSTIPVR
jgi:pimeloyl-ACP methyl ester carboxylesterase